MSELGNYVFEFLPSVSKEQIAYFVGAMAVIIYTTRHDG